MKQELEDQLYEKFDFFMNNGNPIKIRCEDGWFDLIYNMCEKIQEIVDEKYYEFDFKFLQIREKFGGLRADIWEYLPGISEVIDEIEMQSETICERCGKPGKLKEGRAWYKTLCEDCWNEEIDG
jgi:hypothetical protein